MKSLNKIRRKLYKTASFLGDINAISKGPEAMAKRALRKSAHKKASTWINKLFK